MKVSQIKQKVTAKVTKGKAKVAKKCGKAAKCACAVALVSCLASLVAGCLRPTTPSRSQSLVMRECNVFVFGGGTETGDVARVEIASQAMAIETSGTETQTVSPTQTIKTEPEIAVGVGGSSAGVGSSGASKQGTCATIGGGIDAVVDALPSKDSEAKDQEAEAKPAATPSADCPDGACSPL